MRVKAGVTSNPETKLQKIQKIDYMGNLIFIPSIIALIYGLVTGGVQEPWSSWRVILPLVLGIAGWIAFHVQQHFTSTPSIPSQLFTNRTSAAAFVLTFLSSVLVQMMSYFLPVYFQAVKGTTALRSGVYFLPFAIGTLVFAVIAGTLLGKFGAYRPLHASALALSVVGFGLFTTLNGSTSKGAWVVFELIASAGSGLILSVLLPAIMAGLPESYVASSSAAYSFIRTFGYVWGVTVPSIVFNGVFDKNLHVISSASLRDQLSGGKAYSFASQAHLVRNTVPDDVWNEVVDVYSKSLKTIWWVGLGLSIVGFIAVGGERGLELRKELETDYGIDDKKIHDEKPSRTTVGNDNAISVEGSG